MATFVFMYLSTGDVLGNENSHTLWKLLSQRLKKQCYVVIVSLFAFKNVLVIWEPYMAPPQRLLYYSGQWPEGGGAHVLGYRLLGF